VELLELGRHFGVQPTPIRAMRRELLSTLRHQQRPVLQPTAQTSTALQSAQSTAERSGRSSCTEYAEQLY
jgi:hypothetical protein